MVPNDYEDRSEIEKLFRTYCRLLDQGRFAEWVDLFTADGVYLVITHENLQDQGMLLLKDDGRDALKERAAFLMGYYQSERCKTLHTCCNVELGAISGNEATCNSYFVVYRTASDGFPQLHSCGEYRDRLFRENGRWVFRERLVVIDNETLPENFTDLL